MLKSIQKLFSAPAEQPAALAVNQEEDKSMSAKEGQSSAGNTTNVAAELTAQLASQAETLAAAQTALAELTTKYGAAQASLTAIAAEKAQMEADATAKVAATRLEQLTAVLGTTKAPDIAAALQGLDDTTFAVVLGTYAKSYEDEKASFKEIGVSAEATKEEKPVHFNTFINKK